MQDVTVNCEFVLGWVLGFGLWRALPLPCRYEVGDEVIEVMVASSNRCSCLMIRCQTDAGWNLYCCQLPTNTDASDSGL